MSDLYVTVTGIKHYFGLLPFNVGTTLLLLSEKDNEYDKHAIAVYREGYGKVGYVANNRQTKAEGTSSASSVWAYTAKGKLAEVQFIAGDYVLAKIL